MKDAKLVVLFVHSGGFWKWDCFNLARELGYYSVCAEAQGMDLSQLCGVADYTFPVRLYNTDSLLDEVEAGLAAREIARPDGVVTYFELAVEQAALIAAHYDLSAIQGEAAHRARNKFDMRQAIADPFFHDGYERVESKEHVLAFFERHGRVPVVLKPCDLGASTGVVRIIDVEEIASAWAEAQEALQKFAELYGYDTTSGLMVERMMPMGSREYNVDLFVNNGHPYVIGVAEKQDLYDGPSFREDAYVFPPFSLSAAEQRALEHEARRAVRAVGVTSGAVHLEAKMIPAADNELRPCVIELGARCAGDLEMPALKHHRGGTVDLRVLVLEQAVDRLTESHLEAARRCDEGLAPSIPVAICVKYAPKAGTLVTDISIPQDVVHHCRVVNSRFEAGKGHLVVLPENDYLGAVICEGDTATDALENVNAAIARIAVEMEDTESPNVLRELHSVRAAEVVA